MKKTGCCVFLLLCLILLLTGCGSSTEKTKVVLTTGFDKDEVFRIENMSCTLPEVMVYLTNTQNQYEDIYGAQIWESELQNASLEQSVKDSVLGQLAQIKVMNLLADKYEVTLSERENELAEQAGADYFATLDETEIAALGVTEKLITQMYQEYAIADKVYRYIIKDINPEISDDEARTITIEHILIKTYSLDGSGSRVPYSEEEKAQAYKKAQEALEELKGGADFESLVSKYNEDSKSIYSFGKGEMSDDFEKAAFNLGTDEVSDIVETEYGYHLIKCISTFNREETDANKVKIVEQRRKEVFSQEYDAFAESLNRNLNETLWDSVAMLHDSQISTTTFFRVYNTCFEGVFQ